MAFRCVHRNDRNPDRRLRIGYVSPDFRTHALAYFFEPILAAHDRGQFEIFAYAELEKPDETTARMRSCVSGWREIGRQNDAEVARQIQADGIDILVDLAGHTAQNRLGVFAYKPAPVQATYLGYINTSGLATMDYRITDAVADPPSEARQTTEELVRLPAGFCCYAPPAEAPTVNDLPLAGNGHITFGSPHNLNKLNDEVIGLWSEILRAIPTARLRIVRKTLRGRETRERLLGQFDRYGNFRDRIDLEWELLPFPRYFEMYHHFDVVLDTFPANGHTITCEALWMGVPVLTLLGGRYAGRMSGSVLQCLGLSEWAAATPEEYIGRAVQVADDPNQLGVLRAALRERMRCSPLCDSLTFTRNLESAYRQMWQRWCAFSR
jgi:protein O-GlcNAc transferase